MQRGWRPSAAGASTRSQPWVNPARPRARAGPGYVGIGSQEGRSGRSDERVRFRVAEGGSGDRRGQRHPADRPDPGLRSPRGDRHRHAGQPGAQDGWRPGCGHRGHARPVGRRVGHLDAVRQHRGQALAERREPDRDGRGGRRARRPVAEQPGRRRRLRGHLQRGRPAADRGVAGHHGRDDSRVPDHRAGHRGPGRRAPGLHVRLRRSVERGPDPARVPGPGRTSRAHARRDPARPRGGNPRGRTGRAGQDRPGHPRRAGPLAGRGVGQPAGRRGPADGGITPRGQPRAHQGHRVHRPGRNADPGGPGGGPPGHPGAARGRGAAARPAGRAGRPVPGSRRRHRKPHRHRLTAPAVRAGHPRRLPDGAGRADQRPQARAGPAGDARPRLPSRPGHGQRGQPAAVGRPPGAARGNRRRRRPDRADRARRAGRRHARGGAGRGAWRIDLTIPA